MEGAYEKLRVDNYSRMLEMRHTCQFVYGGRHQKKNKLRLLLRVRCEATSRIFPIWQIKFQSRLAMSCQLRPMHAACKKNVNRMSPGFSPFSLRRDVAFSGTYHSPDFRSGQSPCAQPVSPLRASQPFSSPVGPRCLCEPANSLLRCCGRVCLAS